MRATNLRAKDIWAGLVLMSVAAIFAVTALDYTLGTARNLDSGAFPLLLSILLLGLGLAVTCIGVVKGGGGIEQWTWRGLLLIIGPPIFFGIFIRELGLIPCLLIVAFTSSLASRYARLHLSLILAVVLTLFCTGVFIYGLGLPIPLFGRWLGGY